MGILLSSDKIDAGAIERFLEELPGKALNLGVRVLFTLVVFFICIKLIKLVRKILKRALTKANADVGVIQFLDSAVKAVLYLLVIFMLATSFGLDAASVIAVVGSAGVTVGLALQGSLSNLAGGVLILLLKPFRVGDYIIEDSHSNEGTVHEIGLFYTKLKTGDNRIVVLPNGSLANTSLTNVTTSDRRRVDFNFGIGYQCDINKAKEIVKDILLSEEKSLKNEDISVFVANLAASEVTIGARCWTLTSDYWEVKWGVTEKVKYAFDKADIEIPYNKMDVYVKETVEKQ